MPATMLSADDIKDIITRRDREWEEALKAAFPDFNAPLTPGMVPVWGQKIDDYFEEAINLAFRNADDC